MSIILHACTNILSSFTTLLALDNYPDAMTTPVLNKMLKSGQEEEGTQRPSWARVVGGGGARKMKEKKECVPVTVQEPMSPHRTPGSTSYLTTTSPNHRIPVSPGAPVNTPSTPLKYGSRPGTPLPNPWSPAPSPSASPSLYGLNITLALLTDNSSILDETFPTMTASTSREDKASVQSPGEDESPGLLVGLGITGLYKKGGEAFDGLGIVASNFKHLTMADDQPKTGGGDEDYENLSDVFLNEAAFTFSSSSSHGPANQSTPPNRPVIVQDGVFFFSPKPSKARGKGMGMKRDLSHPTISSALKKFKAGKVAQKGRRVGPVWKL